MDVDKLEAGPETDALVAEYVMGWNRLSLLENKGFAIPEHQRQPWLIPRGIVIMDVPRWSEDWAAAWEVIEELTDKGYCPGLIFDDNGHWALALEGTQNIPIGPDPQDIATSFFVSAEMWYDSAPLAICRAALKAFNVG